MGWAGLALSSLTVCLPWSAVAAGIFPARPRLAMRPAAWKSIDVGRVQAEKRGIVQSRLVSPKALVTLQTADRGVL